MKDNRNVSLDILRALSMLFMVISHYIYHGIKSRPDLSDYYSLQTSSGVINYLSINALYIISCVAVNCFVMISGYFLINKKNFRWKGIFSTWTEVFFYSVLFLLISFIMGQEISSKEILNSILPIFGQRYWFMTFYFGLMLLAPIISRAMADLNMNQYRVVLLIMFVVNFQYLYGAVFGGFASLLWFSFLFIVGGYVRKFGCIKWIKNYKGSLLVGIWSVLTFMALAYNLLREGKTELVSTSYHGPIFFLSFIVFCFFVFTEFKGKWANIICDISPYTLAVYLIHANGFLERTSLGDYNTRRF